MVKQPSVIVLSGGSRGLGQALVLDLLKEGHTIYTFSRTKTQFIDDMEVEFAGRLYWKAIDGTDFDAVEAYIKEAYEKEGRIDVAINNAGVALDGVLTLTNPSQITSVIALNLEGAIRMARSCAKYMLQAKRGSIINISSIIGIRGYSGLSVYGATKAGLDGFTRGLAREIGGRGIRVNSIAPGYLETEMSEKLDANQRGQIVRRTPLGRLGKVDDVTGVVRFLISEDSKFITGQTLAVDGGITC